MRYSSLDLLRSRNQGSDAQQWSANDARPAVANLTGELCRHDDGEITFLSSWNRQQRSDGFVSTRGGGGQDLVS